jgi:hypothetical protein
MDDSFLLLPGFNTFEPSLSIIAAKRAFAMQRPLTL